MLTRCSLFFILFFIFSSANAICSNPNYFATIGNLPISFEDKKEFWWEGNHWPDFHTLDEYDSGDLKQWITLLQEYQLTSIIKQDAYAYRQCDYASALLAFSALRHDIPNQRNELLSWLSNQDKVLAACKKNPNVTLSYPKTMSVRYAQEAEYQKWALQYYQEENADKFIPGFRAIGMTKGHPRQADALRTWVRIIYNEKGLTAAWEESEKIKTNEATKTLWPSIENMRFEMMGRARSDSFSSDRDPQDNPLVQEKIISWLMSIIRDYEIPGKLEKQTDKNRFSDALFNLLTWYVPESGKPKIDWWLSEDNLESDMLQAARKKMKEDDLLAWIQLDKTRNPSTLMRLYENSSDVEKKHLSEFAFSKYQNCRGVEWLPYALSFAVKGQSSLNEIINAAYSALDDATLQKVHPKFRTQLWKELVLAELLANHNEKALETLVRQDVGFEHDETHHLVLNDMLSWFIHQGEYDWGRKVLATQRDHRDNADYAIFQVILADTPDLFRQRLLQVDSRVQSSPLLRPVFNLLPARELLSLANLKRDFADLPLSQSLAKTAFTRAWLLGDRALMEQSALTLEKVDTTGDKSSLKIINGDDLSQTLFFLSHPRMRMTGIGFDLSEKSSAWSSAEIDVFNHNDNNWWCSFKPQAEKKDLYDQFALMSAPNPDLFAAKRARAIAAHPLMKLIDEKELNALSKIPAAPQFLSQRALNESHEKLSFLKKKFPFFRRFFHDDRMPEALHLAVRATRYGCDRDGDMGAYSKKSFQRLHYHFRKSSWAKATPYWFENYKEEVME